MSLTRVISTVVGVVLGYAISAVGLVGLGKLLAQAVIAGSIRWDALHRAVLLFFAGMIFAVALALSFQ